MPPALMHIVGHKAIRIFCEEHPHARGALDRWYRVAKRAAWSSFAEMKQPFNTADFVAPHVVFNGRRQTGFLDLEAIEMAVRSAMHHAGAAALSELLQFPAPAADQRTVACPCGHQASYRDIRSEPVLTAVGPARVSRPYYLCSHCHTGQFPADVELDIENTEVSPGVRRMQAVVGQEALFDHGREQLKLLADLEVTTNESEISAAMSARVSRRFAPEIAPLHQSLGVFRENP